MYFGEFTQEYLSRVMENPDFYYKEFQELLAASEEERTIYHGELVPMTYQGMYFGKEEVKLFKSIIKTMVSIGKKITAEFLKNPDYRQKFRFDSMTEQLILQDPGYSMPVPIGRYDIFYNGGEDFKFCELNTDGSSAMNEDRVIGKLLKKTTIYREMKKEWKISSFSLFKSLVKISLKRYRSIRGRNPRKVAIVDFMDKATKEEFLVFQKAYEKEGVSCLIADPRDFLYEDHKLIYCHPESGKKETVDMVYRRAVTSDFVDRLEECRPFYEAYSAKDFVMFGSFRSQIMHSKMIFKMLFDPRTREILSDSENRFVAKHVPMTREILTPEDKEELLAKKDHYIIKPYNAYASRGILLGQEWDDAKWKEKIEALPYNQYIYQEFVRMDKTPFLEDNGKTFTINKLGHVLGLFLYDEKFAGCYIRAGHSGIISSARDYYTIPAFVVEKRDS